MPSPTRDRRSSCALESQDLTQLLAHLTEGLHAMAQPLTILRSSVPALAAAGIDSARQKRYGDMSVRQVQRVCELFDCLQDLVLAAHTEAECAPVDIASMIATVAEDRRASFQALGAELRVHLPGALPVAQANASRTHQALMSGFSAAALIAAAGDIIEVSAKARNRRIEIVCHIDRIHGIRLESPQLLALRLAQINMLSQQGDYEYTDDPFRLRLALPFA